MTKDHFQARVAPATSFVVTVLASVAGTSTGQVIDAALDALMLALARQGKIGGSLRAGILNHERIGNTRMQKLVYLFEDSDGQMNRKPKEAVSKRPRGRPKKVRLQDPILAAARTVK